MRKIMLLGKTGAGKTTLIQVLAGQEIEYKKTQAVEYVEGMLDTPGEYLEHKNYYRALTVSAVDYDTIMFLQPADDELNYFPAGFSAMFMGKDVVGIITKSDSPDADIPRAREVLENAGSERIFEISSYSGQGIQELKNFVNEDVNSHKLSSI